MIPKSQGVEVRGEVDMLVRAAHPNVVQFTACFQTRVHMCLVMEFVAGCTLAAVIRVGALMEEPLPYPRAAAAAAAAAEPASAAVTVIAGSALVAPATGGGVEGVGGGESEEDDEGVGGRVIVESGSCDEDGIDDDDEAAVLTATAVAAAEGLLQASHGGPAFSLVHRTGSVRSLSSLDNGSGGGIDGGSGGRSRRDSVGSTQTSSCNSSSSRGSSRRNRRRSRSRSRGADTAAWVGEGGGGHGRGRGFSTIHPLVFCMGELVVTLGHIHSLGIVHRDVKPANCMIGEDGHLKLIGFGVACFLNGSAGGGEGSSDIDKVSGSRRGGGNGMMVRRLHAPAPAPAPALAVAHTPELSGSVLPLLKSLLPLRPLTVLKRQVRVLVVEDDMVTAMTTTALISSLGFGEVHSVRNGSEALAQLQLGRKRPAGGGGGNGIGNGNGKGRGKGGDGQSETSLLTDERTSYSSALDGHPDFPMRVRANHPYGPFDVVLLDMCMPVMDGPSTLTAIQADPDLRDIPVIMLSAADNTGAISNCLQAGAKDYCIKPVQPSVEEVLMKYASQYRRMIHAATVAADADAAADANSNSSSGGEGRGSSCGSFSSYTSYKSMGGGSGMGSPVPRPEFHELVNGWRLTGLKVSREGGDSQKTGDETSEGKERGQGRGRRRRRRRRTERGSDPDSGSSSGSGASLPRTKRSGRRNSSSGTRKGRPGRRRGHSRSTDGSSSTTAPAPPAHHKTTRGWIGNPAYMAPEVVLQRRYSPASDWWAFGVILYQCLVGRPPFPGTTPQAVFDAVSRGKVDFRRIRGVEYAAARSLLAGLLNPNPELRLGTRGGVGEIRAHPFFEQITDWGTLHAQVPPYVPVPGLIVDQIDSSARVLDAAKTMFSGVSKGDLE